MCFMGCVDYRVCMKQRREGMGTARMERMGTRLGGYMHEYGSGSIGTLGLVREKEKRLIDLNACTILG